MSRDELRSQVAGIRMKSIDEHIQKDQSEIEAAKAKEQAWLATKPGRGASIVEVAAWQRRCSQSGL